MSAKTKPLSQCMGVFVYINGHFTEVYHKKDNKIISANVTLNDFCQEVRMSERLKNDRAPGFSGRDSASKRNG